MNRALSALLLLGFLAMNLAWIDADRLLRDGDEEGHVGAAELILDDLRNERFEAAAAKAVYEDMGDYPALYPATVGAWWWAADGGPPGRVMVRGVNLLFLLLTALGIAGAARALGAPAAAAALGGAAVTWLPLNAALARHFMPEGALAAPVALTLWAAASQRPKRSAGPALALGLCIAAGLLTKQTYPLYVALPLALLVRPGPALVWVALGASAAAPWLLHNLGEQLAYAELSTVYAVPVPWTEQALFYPRSLWYTGLGPVWALVLAAAAALGLSGAHRRLAAIGLASVLGGLLLLSFIPKKYDRLSAPLLPGAGLVLAAAVATRPRASLALLPGVAWTAWLSWTPSPWSEPPEVIAEFHPGCVQRWMRPPFTEPSGLEAVAEAARDVPYGAVRVRGAPEIPCAIQTTHGWGQHLGPYLRRVGLDRPVTFDDEPADQGVETLLVDFEGEGAGQEVSLDWLDARFTVGPP
ncbi:MAG: hypothetical protein H6741_23100 [Alphaproteobacteria bacterium]|nr:hypothetical protein [Alphaproteobacteria bacterium]